MAVCRGCLIMTFELLKERKSILEQQFQNAQLRLQKAQKNEEEALGDMNAINGAIQEVLFWIDKIKGDDIKND